VSSGQFTAAQLAIDFLSKSPIELSYWAPLLRKGQVQALQKFDVFPPVFFDFDIQL
jgi:hypothetical protein